MSDPDPTEFEEQTGNDCDDISVIAIGASAGGLEALSDMLAEARPGAPVAFVVIQHLSPDQRSILHELLQSKCAIPVTQIQQDEVIEPGHVYVVPPGKFAELRGGTLHLTERADIDQVFRPIDHFFGSLAESLGRRAYCVILSGTGSDGSEGLREVKSAGGFVVAQEAGDARFPGMPDAAIATGLVDFVLATRDIIPRLIEIVHHRGSIDDTASRERMLADIEAVLPEIFSELRDITGHDFSDYKPGTVIRRIERRMSLMRILDAKAFAKIIRNDEKEANVLAQDFLIGVTSFFRDEEAFEALRGQVVDPIVESEPLSIRVWVPGCSTGEEAYSIAMLFQEALEAAGTRASLQVFGTDIDNHALLAARNGIFSQAAVAKLSPERLQRFFAAENGAYRANVSLREVCVFAPHNLVQDPPFSRLDLISCRNVMIYLSTRLQNRVLPRFHFSLKPEGFLFVGPSEGLAGEERLFRAVDKTFRIFQRNDDIEPAYSSLTEIVPRAGKTRGASTISASPLSAEASATPSWEIAAERTFLSKYAAPFAVISASGEVRYMSSAMAAFARPAAGTPSNQIDSFLTSELRVPVRRALVEAEQSGEDQKVAGVLVAMNPDNPVMYDFTLSRMDQAKDNFLLVLSEIRATDTEAIGEAIDLRETTDQEILVGENARLRRHLTEVLQEFETSGQELKSSNEELMSMNEELQSSNEELETSREELQSINEELETVNAELRENNRRLVRANSDLKNLFESTDIAVLFLDRNFIVRSFTPATTQLYGMKDRDIGRPIFDLSSRIRYPDLRADAEQVDATLQPIEREVQIEETGETFLLRIRPYRTTDDRIDGYVVSFVNITQRKRNEQALERNQRELAEQYAELENLYDTTPVGLSLMDRDFRYVRINQMLADINGFSIEEHIGNHFTDLLPDLAQDMSQIYKTVFETGEASLRNEVSAELPSDPGTLRHFIAELYPIRVDGEVRAIGTCVTEVTEQKRLMAQLEESESRIKRLFDNSPVFIAFTEGPDHVYTYSNPPHDRIVGGRPLVGKPMLEAVPELKDQGIKERFDQVLATGERMHVPEFEAILDRDGSGKLQPGWFLQTLEPMLDGDGRTIGVATFAFDISDIVRAKNDAQKAEEQKTLLLGELQHRVKNMLATIRAVAKLLVPGAGDAREYQKRLGDRLMSMSRTHDLLFGEGIVSTGIHALVNAEAAPYQGEASRRVVAVTGDDFDVSSDEAPLIGMALHELMTNAAKYGALASDSGLIEVHCEVDPATEERKFTWQESGGPPVEKPDDRTGFGSIVIEQVLSSNLDAGVHTDFRPEGLFVSVVLKPARKAGDVDA